jgi:hypothetical protein
MDDIVLPRSLQRHIFQNNSPLLDHLLYFVVPNANAEF